MLLEPASVAFMESLQGYGRALLNFYVPSVAYGSFFRFDPVKGQRNDYDEFSTDDSG